MVVPASYAPDEAVDAVIVDASLAAKWIVEENDSEHAQRMLDTWASRGTRLVVPAHFFAECGSIVYKRVTHRQLTADEALAALDALYSVEFVYHSDPLLTRAAVDVAARYELPSAYDGHYVALAEMYQVPFWTADRRLMNAFQRQHPLVKWIGNFPSA